MDSLSASNGNFTLELFKNLNLSAQGNNIFFSPLSISSALALLYLGSRGNTASQVAKVLHFNAVKELESSPQEPTPKRDENIHQLFQQLTSKLNQPRSSYLLKSVNRLYGEKGISFIPEFLQLAKEYYQAEPQAVDFEKAAEQVRKQINSWVEAQTEKKIKDLLPKDAVDSQTALVIVNAIYFKGKWEKQFHKEDTVEKPFRLSKIQSKPVQMMHVKDKFPFFFIDTLRVSILELPYAGKDFSMLILLPEDIMDESTGLELLEKELTYERLSIWTSPEMMEAMEVEVYLPRFKLEETYDLKATLSSMGMKDAFSHDRADFSGMSKKNNLALSNVFHKSFVDINEEGTEAGAATAAALVMRSSLKPIRFIANQPFLFIIKDNRTNNIVFFGRVSNP